MDQEQLRARLEDLSVRIRLSRSHFRYLRWLKRKMGFEPKVIYDIGACVLHWTKAVKELWPEAEVVLFDAFEPAAFMYEGYRHWVGVLSDQDGREVPFHQNDRHPGGNSYYREIGTKNLFPVGTHTVRRARTLDAIVREYGFPPPDLVKIDVQGAERDVMVGGRQTIGAAQRLVVEMQHEARNDGAPMVLETLPWIESQGWHCDAPLFSDSGGGDGDYGFVRADLVASGTQPSFAG